VFFPASQGLSSANYKAKKEAVADDIIERLEKGLGFKGLKAATVFREVGTPRTHRKFLAREDGTYGPVPSRRPLGLLGMPFNTTVSGLIFMGVKYSETCLPSLSGSRYLLGMPFNTTVSRLTLMRVNYSELCVPSLPGSRYSKRTIDTDR
jgi:hypothetical protein